MKCLTFHVHVYLWLWAENAADPILIWMLSHVWSWRQDEICSEGEKTFSHIKRAHGVCYITELLMGMSLCGHWFRWNNPAGCVIVYRYCIFFTCLFAGLGAHTGNESFQTDSYLFFSSAKRRLQKKLWKGKTFSFVIITNLVFKCILIT